MSETNHIITSDQIDAAWHQGDLTTGEFKEFGIYLLRIFGIERCEGCGGNKKIRGGYSIEQQRYEAIKCPDCDGHGYVINSVDDGPSGSSDPDVGVIGGEDE